MKRVRRYTETMKFKKWISLFYDRSNKTTYGNSTQAAMRAYSAMERSGIAINVSAYLMFSPNLLVLLSVQQVRCILRRAFIVCQTEAKIWAERKGHSIKNTKESFSCSQICRVIRCNFFISSYSTPNVQLSTRKSKFLFLKISRGVGGELRFSKTPYSNITSQEELFPLFKVLIPFLVNSALSSSDFSYSLLLLCSSINFKLF